MGPEAGARNPLRAKMDMKAAERRAERGPETVVATGRQTRIDEGGDCIEMMMI